MKPRPIYEVYVEIDHDARFEYGVRSGITDTVELMQIAGNLTIELLRSHADTLSFFRRWRQVNVPSFNAWDSVFSSLIWRGGSARVHLRLTTPVHYALYNQNLPDEAAVVGDVRYCEVRDRIYDLMHDLKLDAAPLDAPLDDWNGKPHRMLWLDPYVLWLTPTVMPEINEKA